MPLLSTSRIINFLQKNYSNFFQIHNASKHSSQYYSSLSNISISQKKSVEQNAKKIYKGRKPTEKWCEEESQDLLRYVSKIGKNWKQIASLLGTNRSHTTCYNHYKMLTKPYVVEGRWTKEEEANLSSIIKNNFSLYENRKWSKIAMLLGDKRTHIAIRAKVYNDPHSINLLSIIQSQNKSPSDRNEIIENRIKNLKKTKWLKEELALLNYAMEIAGDHLKTVKYFYPENENNTEISADKNPNILNNPKSNSETSFVYFSNLYPMSDQLLSSKRHAISKLQEKKNSGKRVTWVDISDFVSSRTSNQCRHKWFYYFTVIIKKNKLRV
ncbi:Myb-like protein C [Smittium culicis]|uniref:Myb-like protein C n=1 Tax=Smittium culicis TaxID=133412 RepID=A0A1R1XSN0_9FUNG|nr:Myb-like protein C [Smittium culicis]OMJ17662.1 Myb-like protein C [Smittium culicis]